MTIDWWGEKWGSDIGILDKCKDFAFLAEKYGTGFKVFKQT